MQQYHVLHGSSKDHFDSLQHAAHELGAWCRWTVNRLARPNDLAVFYFIQRRSAFVAVGVIADTPKKQRDRTQDWYGHYMAPVEEIVMLRRPVPLAVVKDALPEWDWLKMPIQSTQVPDTLIPRLETLLGIGRVSRWVERVALARTEPPAFVSTP